MKKIILGLVAAFALTSFVAPARAEDAAGGDAAKTDGKKDSKKDTKKSDKKMDAPADGAAKK